MTDPFKDVLIVDDDDSIRDLLHRALSREGLQCDVASDGLHAVERLETERYRVILLDLMMPRLDGVGVVQRLHTLLPPETPPPVVIMITAAGDHSPLAPVADKLHLVIKKPFDVQALRDLVRDCVITAAPHRSASLVPRSKE